MHRSPFERELREIAAELATHAERVRSLSQRSVFSGSKSYTMEEILLHAEELAMAAEREHKLRRMREAIIATDHFGEPAWDLLLDLFAHTVRNKPVPTTAACIGAHCPPTTALRYIETLVSDGMIIRETDPTDGRRTLLRLTDATLVSVGSFLMAMSSPGAFDRKVEAESSDA